MLSNKPVQLSIQSVVEENSNNSYWMKYFSTTDHLVLTCNVQSLTFTCFTATEIALLKNSAKLRSHFSVSIHHGRALLEQICTLLCISGCWFLWQLWDPITVPLSCAVSFSCSLRAIPFFLPPCFKSRPHVSLEEEEEDEEEGVQEEEQWPVEQHSHRGSLTVGSKSVEEERERRRGRKYLEEERERMRERKSVDVVLVN